MKCRQCKRTIENNSLFCNWCGARQIKVKSTERIPRPTPKPNGSFLMQIMVDGKRLSKTFPTEDEAVTWARQLRTHAQAVSSDACEMTLAEAMEAYIAFKENVLSPSTIRSYKLVAKYRFQSLHQMKVADITDSVAQNAVNAEMLLTVRTRSGADTGKPVTAKTVSNAWGLVFSACKEVCGKTLKVTLPKKKPPQHDFLEPDEIKAFLSQVRGSRSEAAILLGLHSLRLSEILALQPEDISTKRKTISVHSALIRGENGRVSKDTTKTASSTRVIPIMIPRLLELTDNIPITINEKTLRSDINKACDALGIRHIGIHGLRHTFASLASSDAVRMPEAEIMKLGGWSTNNIMKKVYTHTVSADRKKSQQSFIDFFAD